MNNLFKSGIFWTMFITVIITAIIIFVFPYYFEEYKVVSYRLLVAFSFFFIISILVLLYVLFLQERTQEYLKIREERLRKERERKKLIKIKIKDIKIRFLEALKILRKSTLYRNKRRARYELPWYLVMGQNNEGKTSLLEGSGLDFPLNMNFNDQKVKEVGSSESFEWLYAEHAIFIDMPGNYIHNTNNDYDTEVWEKGFLNIFAKKRSKRPINGIVLNISIDTFLNKSENELEQYAKDLRNRFDELSDGFVSSIPIYLVITKSDNLEGFNEYFSNISEDEKDEVLGITFDDPNENVDTKILNVKFDELLKRLNSSVIDKIHTEWEEDSKSKILLFCDSFSEVFERINIFTDICFSQTRYRKPLMLRGIYFTSIPKVQEASTSYLVSPKTNGQLKKARSSKGLFIKNLLEDVIFPEADLINMDKSYKKSSLRKQSIAITLSLCLITIFSVFLVQDFVAHNNLLHTMENDFRKSQEVKSKIKKSDNFENVVENLNMFNDLKEKHIKRTSNSFYMINFYQTDEKNVELINLYHSNLLSTLLPRVEELLNKQVLSNISNYKRTWSNLEAYLMLNNEKYRNDDLLKTLLSDYWARLYPNKPSIQKDLNKHWANLLSFGFPQVSLNKKTLKVARAKLSKKGYVQITYNGLKHLVDETMNFKSFTFSQVIGSNVSSFNGSSVVVPGFYTKEGYEKVIVAKGKSLVKEVLVNNWVLGSNLNLSDSQINSIYSKVLSYYFKDYKRYWLTAINSLSIPKRSNIAGLNNQLEILSSGDSPILSILQAIKLNTDIYSPAELLKFKSSDDKSLLNKVKKLAQKNALKKAEKLMPSTSVKNVRKFFLPFSKLVDKDNNANADLQNAIGKLDQTFKEMTSIFGAIEIDKDSYGIVKNRLNGKHESFLVKFNALPIQVSKWYKRVLLSNWQFLLKESRVYITKKYKEDVLIFYTNKMKGKYPLKRNNYTQSINIDDFSEFFRAGGVVDEFYNQYIKDFVRINKKSYKSYRLKVIDGSTLRLSRTFMQNILRTFRIRNMMFSNKGTVLNIKASLKANVLEKTLSTMTFDYGDDSIVYEHGPIKNNYIQWPNDNNYTNFSLYNLNNEKILDKSTSGEWSLFVLIDKFRVKKISNNLISFEYKKDKYLASIYLKGKVSKLFTKSNPLRYFKLKGKI